jgi:hypothetical protein
MPETTHFSTAFIIPNYKDWESLQLLISNLKTELKDKCDSCIFFIIDDCSLVIDENVLKSNPRQIIVVELVRNLGHQKAIAIGLSFVTENYPDLEQIIVMDGDGEDQPADAVEMLNISQKNQNVIIFAKRLRREEGKMFKTFYVFYKMLFRLLTGKKIDFGNFSVLPFPMAKRLAYVSEIWLNYPSGIINSRLPYLTYPANKGTRYRGKSKMNFVGLINHGLSAMAVYSEFVAVRVILFTLFLIVLAIAIMLFVLGIKNFTTLAIPGWTTYVILGLSMLIFQIFSFGALFAFLIQSNKTQSSTIPVEVYKKFIYKIHG